MKNVIEILCIIVCLSAAMIPGTAAVVSNQGWIQVISNVDGASVYFDNKYQGLTSEGQLTVTVYPAAPVSTYRVEKDGFTTAAGTLTMPEAGATTKAYAVLRPVSTPTPTATYGGLSVDSSPQGAKIYLNGFYRDVSPFTFNQLTPGSYTVAFVLDGYQSYSTLVRVTAGTTTNVYTALASVSSSPNSIYITSDPTNAFVYLDTLYEGKTPLTITGITPGDHLVELKAPGYYTWNTTVSLPGGSTRTVSAQMISLTPAVTTTAVTVPATPTRTSTRAGAVPVVVIGALGIAGLAAGIMRKN
jgi:PEGA domain